MLPSHASRFCDDTSELADHKNNHRFPFATRACQPTAAPAVADQPWPGSYKGCGYKIRTSEYQKL